MEKRRLKTACPCESHESVSAYAVGLLLTDLGCSACFQDMRKCLIRGDNETTITYSDKFVLDLHDFVRPSEAPGIGPVTLFVTCAKEGKRNKVL